MEGALRLARQQVEHYRREADKLARLQKLQVVACSWAGCTRMGAWFGGSVLLLRACCSQADRLPSSSVLQMAPAMQQLCALHQLSVKVFKHKGAASVSAPERRGRR